MSSMFPEVMRKPNRAPSPGVAPGTGGSSATPQIYTPPLLQGVSAGGAIDKARVTGTPIPSGSNDRDTTQVATPEFDFNKWMWDEQERRRKQNAIATLRALMTEYNLQGLMSKIEQYVVDGYDADAIMVLIRTTPEYKQRFPAMETLAKKGRAISEGAYIEYERAASGLERQYGLPAGMLMGNVTELLEKEVSATELNDRVLMAAGSAYQMPQEFRTQFQEYYGIDTGGLTAYFLDPDVATPLLQRQFGAAMIGSEAARQNVGVQVGLAEELQTLGVTQEQARTGFGEVAGRRGLTEGRGDIVTQEQLVRGTLASDEAAMQQIERAAGARVGRFRESAGFVATERGVTGLAGTTTS